MKCASWALDHNVAVVISNGQIDKAILNIVDGKKIGTFFTNAPAETLPVDVQALKGKFFFVDMIEKVFNEFGNNLARDGSRLLQRLTAEQRKTIINKMASNLIEYSKDILQANKQDLEEATKEGTYE